MLFDTAAHGSVLKEAGCASSVAPAERKTNREILTNMSHADLSRGATDSPFLAGGGEMGAAVRAFGWEKTSIGPVEDWPPCLKTTVAVLLHSPVAMVLLWGEDGVMIYNDAYRMFAAHRHPAALGMKVREAWPEVADFNDNVMTTCLSGGTLSYKDQELILYRRGNPERVCMDLDYSPVLDEAGEPAGVIALVVETTQRVLADQRVQAERERLLQLFDQAPGFMAMLAGPDHVFEMANPAYMQLVGHRGILGRTVQHALPEVAGQGFFELLDQVFETGEVFAGNALKVSLQRDPDGPVEERHVDFVYQPIRDAAGQVTGIFVEGYDVTERVRGEVHLRLLMNELNHRLKNTLATVQAIAAQTLRRAASVEEAEVNLSGRIMALSRAQDVLTREHWNGADLARVVAVAVEPHASDRQRRFHISGPPVELGTRAALSLSLALHELATNAAKYGALSSDQGEIRIEWHVDRNPNPVLKLQWEETGGPAVASPSRKGFGSQLIERGLAMELDADVRTEFRPSGLIFQLSVALKSLEGGSSLDPQELPSSAPR